MLTDKNKPRIHFIGIGGVSMSALAKYARYFGFPVSGSDNGGGEALSELSAIGCKIYCGHAEENVVGADIVVYNDAVKENNVELGYALKNGLYVLPRAEFLAMVAENFRERIGVCGCHGKTTATCMFAHVLKCAREQFTAHIGGYDKEFGNLAFYGGEVFLSEVCEFKRNIDKFSPTVALCMSEDPDHLDCYRSEADLYASYDRFFSKAKRAILYCGDERLAGYKGENAVFFGFDEGKYRAEKISSDRGRYSFNLTADGEKLCRVKLSVFGRHNVVNALGVAAAALETGYSVGAVKRGLESFKGVARRFEEIGKTGRATVIADYAHHPTEIETALAAAREISEEITVVFQPHTYSRTLFLKKEFIKTLEKADDLIIYKTFPAREELIEGGDAKDLAEELGNAEYFDDSGELFERIREKGKSREVILILGAGDLYFEIKNKFSVF